MLGKTPGQRKKKSAFKAVAEDEKRRYVVPMILSFSSLKVVYYQILVYL